MIIRPKISKFQTGGTTKVPQWYLNLYKLQLLAGWNNTLNKNYANLNLNINNHYNAGNLETVYNKNASYTRTPAVVGQDIQSFYDSDGGNMTPEEFVKYYNENAEKIRNHWASNQTYNKRTAGDHNRLYRRMFKNRSNTSNELGSEYNIGYLEGVTEGGYDIQDVEGSSTWLRRMDRYENEFDPNNPDLNRIHEITLKDGSKVKVYKKANGDIGLLEENNLFNQNQDLNTNEQNPQEGTVSVGNEGSVDVALDEWRDNNPLKNLNLRKFTPAALYAGKLLNTFRTNKKVYEHMKKSIFPVLQLSYNTHRQIVGDEGTRLYYYSRAAEGQAKASLPVTSDMDRQIAYQMEAKRIGDLMRAEGDLADNKEIRRTSDESMLHSWQNKARDTLITNENIMAIGKAKAAIHQLDAQEASARGTSINNALDEVFSRSLKLDALLQARNDEIKKYDYILGEKYDLQNEQNAYIKAEEEYQNATTSKEKAEALKKVNTALENLKRARLERRRRWIYENSPQYGLFAKKGGKFDLDVDLLYKVTRDAVKHFREMSKLTDDSRIKTLPKAVKLKGIPKKAKKYLYGGQAPFIVYTPLALGGGEGTTASASSSTKSNDKKDKNETLDVIKDLFKDIAGKGLLSDVSVAYDQISGLLRQVQASGSEMNSNDLEALYLKLLQIVNNLQLEKAAWEDALKRVDQNKGLNEIAVDSLGKLVVQDRETNEIVRKSLNEVIEGEGRYNPITNNQLLLLRKFNMPFDSELISVVNSGVGIEKIAEYIRTNIGTLGTSEFTQEGYSKKEAEQISSGILLLQQAAQKGLAMAPDGVYKGEHYTKTLEQLMAYAIRYIKKILPENMKTILSIHSGGNLDVAISEAIAQRVHDEQKITWTASTGKASANGDNDKTSSEGLKLDSATALVSGKGFLSPIEFNTGTSYAVTVNGIHTSFLKKSGENMGQTTMKEALLSTLQGVLDWNKATLGGSHINPTAYDHVVINNGDVIGVDLPVGKDRNTPDFSMLKQLQTLDLEILKRGINLNDWQKINALCKELGIPEKYKGPGLLNDREWNRFAAFLVTTDDSALSDKNALLNDMIGIADDTTRELYKETMIKNGNKNYDLSDGFLFTDWGKLELYQGTIFVPIKSNYVGAALSGGQDIYMSQATDLELREKGYNNAKTASYKPGMTTSNLLNN